MSFSAYPFFLFPFHCQQLTLSILGLTTSQKFWLHNCGRQKDDFYFLKFFTNISHRQFSFFKDLCLFSRLEESMS